MTGSRIPAAAEVAFVVADEYQDHGLGSMLLERLVETAKRAGIGEFKASVLAENSAMLAVFHGAGFPITQSRTLDVVELVDGDRPTLLLRVAYAKRMSQVIVCSLENPPRPLRAGQTRRGAFRLPGPGGSRMTRRASRLAHGC